MRILALPSASSIQLYVTGSMARVLIVDDDADGSEAVARWLEQGGHHVVRAGDGKRALALLATAAPDVVVLDLMMPQLDGIGFLKVARSCFGGIPAGVIVLTALPDGSQVRRAVELGARRVFRKAGFSLDDLLACVNDLAGERRQQLPARQVPPDYEGNGFPSLSQGSTVTTATRVHWKVVPRPNDGSNSTS